MCMLLLWLTLTYQPGGGARVLSHVVHSNTQRQRLSDPEPGIGTD